MIPPRKAQPPARRPAGRILQLNRLFNTREEIDAYLAINFKDQNVKIFKTWQVTNIACEILLPE